MKSVNKRDEDEWTDECEELLAEWSEKASCYRWLHGRCEKSYKKWYYCFSIPVIILSTLTGAANVGMDSFVAPESKSIASAIVGGVNIFAGIISTLQNFLKVAEFMEGHRIAGVSWGKLQRNIAIELALDPRRRVLQTDFLKLCRAEYDRLIEAGPLIDDNIISQFNKKFSNYEVSKPSICNGLDKCNIYKIDKDLEMNQREFIEGIEDIIENDNIEDKILQVNVDTINYTTDTEEMEEKEYVEEKEDGKDKEDKEDNEDKEDREDREDVEDKGKTTDKVESLNKGVQVEVDKDNKGNIEDKEDKETEEEEDTRETNEEISIFLDDINKND